MLLSASFKIKGDCPREYETVLTQMLLSYSGICQRFAENQKKQPRTNDKQSKKGSGIRTHIRDDPLSVLILVYDFMSTVSNVESEFYSDAFISSLELLVQYEGFCTPYHLTQRIQLLFTSYTRIVNFWIRICYRRKIQLNIIMIRDRVLRNLFTLSSIVRNIDSSQRITLIYLMFFLLRLYKSGIFRPYLFYLSNYFFFFSTDHYSLDLFASRVYGLYVRILDPLPNDLIPSEIWLIVVNLGLMLRQWDLKSSVLFSGLKILQNLVRKIELRECDCGDKYCEND